MTKTSILKITSLLCLVLPAAADPVLATLFGDHAVLQRDRPLPVWGTAEPGEKLTITLGQRQADTSADAEGKWSVILATQPVSSEPLEMLVKGKTTISRTDLLFGDVWLCSGQSNMDMALGACDVPDEISSANHPLIRHFRTGMNFATRPAQEVSGNWAVCGPGTAAGFSAVAYYFGCELQAEAGVPIGLLTSSVGGTNIELWISQAKLLTTPALSGYADFMRTSLDDYQNQLRDYLPEALAWAVKGTAAAKSGDLIPLPPERPEFPFSDKVSRPRCITLHNGMIAPLAPFALKGAIWYQGENNAGDGDYVEKKKALVEEWRELFQEPGLPFYFVQLAAWQAPNPNPEGGEWGMIRDLQRRCLEIPHTGMACAIDLGDAIDIHPKNKEDVGKRLARWALRNEYGQADLVASGPLFKKITVEHGRLRLHFDSLGGGLMTARKEGHAPAVATPDAKPQRFAIAGEDRRWVWAEAVIDGETVVVRSPEVPHPVAVRYAYCSNPVGANLYNRAGLPASPFRSDDW
ncbi:MAG: sialate O-acetylesterase [Akkermansiaceae bacterium]|jgi:sialate O-acetylesterase